MNKLKTLAPLLIIIIFALGIRLLGVGSRPIWYDEAFSLLFAEKGPAEILSGTLLPKGDTAAAEEHPPLYYFALWGWLKIFGNSVVSGRTFSILVSLVIIVLIYLIANDLFDPPTAQIAAGLSASLPFQVHQAQEIRMYALLTLWLLLATFAYLRARSGNWKWWLVFSVSCAFAQYTHNLAAVYLIPLALTPIFQKDGKTLRALIGAGLVALLLYLPWMLHLPAQFSKVSASYWVTKPGVEKIFTLLLMYLPHLPLPGTLLLFGLLFAVLTVTLAAFQTYLARKNRVPSTNRALWTAYLAFTPPLLLWVISQFVPVYVERALLPAHAMFCIWLGWSLTRTKLPRLIQITAAGFVAVSAVMGIYQHVSYNGFPYGPYAALDQSLENRIASGDLIIHSSKLSYLPAFYHDPSLPQGFILDPSGSGTDTLAPATREMLGLREFNSIEHAADGATQLWFVIFQSSIDEYEAAGRLHPHLEYLDQNFSLEFMESWGGINLYRYTKHTP